MKGITIRYRDNYTLKCSYGSYDFYRWDLDHDFESFRSFIKYISHIRKRQYLSDIKFI